MPPMMPPGGGGQGAALAQKLSELMQDPVAMQGMMKYAQQAGIDPNMLLQGAGGAQGAMPPGPMDMTMGIPPGAGGGPQDMQPPQPNMAPPPGMDIPPGQEQDMVSQEIDRVGATWDGEGTPTENDIERLKADPSETNINSFNEAFGEGAAEEVLSQDMEKPIRDPQGAGKGMEPAYEDEEEDLEASEY